MPSMTAHTDSGLLRAGLLSVRAQERVADVLLGVVLDVVEPYASDYLSADEYSRLCGVVRASVDAAADAALATIETELALVAEADLDISRRLRRARHGRM
jgi:hypothetical protein